MVVYKVVAIHRGKVVENIAVYGSFNRALEKLKHMNKQYYHNLLGDTFAIVAEQAIVVR